MQRIRLSFALLALLLLLPLGLLLDRTLRGLEQERDQRHQSVAGRVFDEAERTIMDFLASEENRPPEHYFFDLSDGRSSPLSEPPTRPFVSDYFQIDDSGGLRSPRFGRDALLALRLRGLVEEQQSRNRTPRKKAHASRAGSANRKDVPAKKERSDALRPGSTRTLQKLDLLERSKKVDRDVDTDTDGEAEANRAESGVTARESYSSYQILDQLNLARRSRENRIAQTLPQPTADRTSMPAASPLEAQAAQSIAPPTWSGIALQSKLTQSALPRMAGYAIDDQHLILHRTAWVPGKGRFQQGLVLDLDAFADWIEKRVIVESGLAQWITFDLVPIRELGALQHEAKGQFIYDHRFGEPFEQLGARLFLASLPDDGSSKNIYTMGILLVAVSTLGLWAMYRRVAIAVDFAERRSNFAAAVSHELKTPLTAIRMYAEMLRDGMVPSAAKRLEYYTTITAEAERLTRLINNVLEFSNLEKRTRKLAITSARVDDTLRAGIQILEPHARARGFSITLDLEPDLPPVRFETDALQQILFNLIDNSLKYAEDASRKEIEVIARAWQGGVRIRVRDHGAGTSPQHLQHLFEPFYRGETELTRRNKGTGIGLALVKGLAEEMHAEIRVRNAAGGGFEVELQLQS